MVFTPLISPAVTPLEPSFATLPDFSMPGSYFSPLTSPALEAQYQNSYPSISSRNTSPTDTQESPSINRSKTSSARRKSVVRNPNRVVKESPSMKPLKKKASELAQLAMANASSQP